MKLESVAVAHPLERGEKLPIDISDDVKKSSKACSMETSPSISDHYNPKHAQPAQNDECRLKTYKAINYKRFDQPSDVRGLIVIRPVNVLFSDGVYYRINRRIKESSRYEDAVTN